MPQNPNNLCWLDMEMTGLDPERERIIEVAMIITDPDLNVLAQSEVYAIHQSDEVLDAMDEWNTATHGRTGLTERVRASKHTEAEVEQKLLAFMAEWVPEKATPMCGNTIHQDRRFMVRYMPALEAYFHYRNLDVSTLKELARRRHPAVAKAWSTRLAPGAGRHYGKHRRDALLPHSFHQAARGRLKRCKGVLCPFKK